MLIAQNLLFDERIIRILEPMSLAFRINISKTKLCGVSKTLNINQKEFKIGLYILSA